MEMLQLFIIILILLIIYKMYQKATCGRYNSDVKMRDKVVIITGANTGIGYTTAEDLAKRGARIILACRDKQKSIKARDALIQSTGNKNIVLKMLDLSSFQSVAEFADDILKTETRIDVLINNAGTGKLDNSLTNDNLPVEAQINHFSPYLLTVTLLPLLKSSAPSRIINVASIMHYIGTIENLEKQAKSALEHTRVYSNTKLANILFSKKLSEVLQGTGVTVNCLHPGPVNTEIFRHQPAIVRFFLSFLFKNAVEGAQTSIYLAVEPSLSNVTGKYFTDCRQTAPAKKAEDEIAANRLWQLSEEVIKAKKKI